MSKKLELIESTCETAGIDSSASVKKRFSLSEISYLVGSVGRGRPIVTPGSGVVAAPRGCCWLAILHSGVSTA